MKKLVLIIMCISISLVFADSITEPANAPSYTMPDMALGFYDQYSRNLLNPSMTARGNSGMALVGGVESAFYNPASMLDDHASMYVELLVKGNSDEFRSSTINNEDEEVPVTFRNQYQSPFPWSFIGFKIKPIANFYLGYSLSMPNSIEYYSFSRILPTDEVIERQPKYINYQNTFTTTYKINNEWSVGLNTLINAYSFQAMRNEGRWDRVNFTEYALRFQPGVLYQKDKLKLGASYLHKTDVKYNYQYVRYSGTMPSMLRTGVVYGDIKDLFVSFDTDYTMYSQQADYLDDQLVLKAGIEKNYKSRNFKKGNYSLKAGIIYSPSVFDGYALVPNFIDPDDQYDPNFFLNIPKYEKINKADLMLLTMGVSVKLNTDVELNLSYATNVKGDTQVDQFNSSLKFDLKVFKALKK